jgi:predicted CXXCH cytochrome family protein
MLPAGKVLGQHNAPCDQCHTEQSKPFVFEHEALRESCTICHSPHGSINDKLLVASDSNLCLRCHAQVTAEGAIELGGQGHDTRLAQGPCWSAGCHTAIHGSNINSSLRY